MGMNSYWNFIPMGIPIGIPIGMPIGIPIGISFLLDPIGIPIGIPNSNWNSNWIQLDFFVRDSHFLAGNIVHQVFLPMYHA
jgi:hypothetical protein